MSQDERGDIDDTYLPVLILTEYTGTSPENFSRFGNDGRVGRGPSSYRRSDVRILLDVAERLTAQRGIDAAALRIEVTDGVVTLSGEVGDRRACRGIEDDVLAVYGVAAVNIGLRNPFPEHHHR